MKTACPNCGGEVEFRYDDSFVRVCPFCRSSVLRTDRGVETLGQFADLVPFDSPLALFAGGQLGHETFLLVGMAQIRQATGGVSQEWYAKFDGRWGWLGEGQGRYYLTFEVPDAPNLPRFEELVPGEQMQLPHQTMTYTVGERGQATYVSATGELPFRLPAGQTYRFVDLSDGAGAFATIDYGDGSEPPTLYEGRQVTLADLQITGGEVAPTDKPIASTKITCPSCGAPVEIRAPGQSLRVVCAYCNSMIDLESTALKNFTKLSVKAQPSIPLGTKGTFADGELTVIGYLSRSAFVDDGWYPFEEYLLYAPKLGFRWLVNSDGHWSYVQPIAPGAVDDLGSAAKYGGVKFRLFQSSTQLRVDQVLGELYWRVTAGEIVQGEDYICPPAMLSRETTADEQNWSLSTYMTSKEVQAAFGTGKPPDLVQDLNLGQRQGVGANQVYPIHGFSFVSSIAFVALIVVAIVAAAMAKGAVRYTHEVVVAQQGTAAAVAPPTPVTPDKPPTLTPSKPPVDVPPVQDPCADYATYAQSLAACTKLSASARAALKRNVDRTKPKLAASPTVGERAVCKGGLESARGAAKKAGCKIAEPGAGSASAGSGSNTGSGSADAGSGSGGTAGSGASDSCVQFHAALDQLMACPKIAPAQQQGLRIALEATVSDASLSPEVQALRCKTALEQVRDSANGAGCPLTLTDAGAPTPPADTPPAEAPGSTFFSDPFELSGGQNIEITVKAFTLNNDWVYFAADLVEDKTGQVITFDDNLEYYSGVDDGESWDEGSRSTDQVIPPVSGGKYVLRVESSHGGTGSQVIEVTVKQGIFRWRYFWLAILVLGIPYFIFGLHEWSFEKKRWDNSSSGRSAAPKTLASIVLMIFGGIFVIIWAIISSMGSSDD